MSTGILVCESIEKSPTDWAMTDQASQVYINVDAFTVKITKHEQGVYVELFARNSNMTTVLGRIDGDRIEAIELMAEDYYDPENLVAFAKNAGVEIDLGNVSKTNPVAVVEKGVKVARFASLTAAFANCAEMIAKGIESKINFGADA